MLEVILARALIVFIAGATRYTAANYVASEVDTALLRADPRTGASNYHPLLAWMADQAGGRAFFVEYVQRTTTVLWEAKDASWYLDGGFEAMDYLETLMAATPEFTRLYTRMSNWEMTEDPFFVPADGADVSNVHNLATLPAVPWDAEPAPCAETYCGPGGMCASTASGKEGCVCAEGFVGRAILAPRVGSAGPLATIACQDASFDLLASIAAGMPSRCDGLTCGEGGACVALNGVPHCACEPGRAVVNDAGTPSCSEITETYGPDALLWPGWPGEEAGDDDTTADDDAAGDDDAAADDDGSPEGCATSCDTGSAGPRASGSLPALLALWASTRRWGKARIG